MKSNLMQEKKLIEKCKQKDRNAFNHLFNTYSRVLMGISIRYANDVAEAEDILQESFIKIFHQIETYESKGSFEGWLKRIVVNTAINYFNSKKVRIDGGGNADDYDMEDQNFNIEDELNGNELLEIINQIPEGYRVIFNLNVVEGYTHKEIAEQFNITEGTSKSQLSKAKAMLRKILTENKMVA